MADQTRGLDILIKAVLNAQGFDDLKSRLQSATADVKEHSDAEKEASDSSKEFGESLSKMGDELAASAAEILAGKEALGFFRDAIAEAIEGEKQLTQFAAANEALGKATKADREENEKWILSLEQASGITKDELIPAYMKLVGATGDVAQAQAYMQIATGAASRGFGDLGTNATVLSRFLLNPDGPVRGFSALAIEINKMKKEGASATQIMTKLGAQFGDAGAAVDTNAQQVARAKVQWSEFKESVGSLAMSIVQYLKPALEIAALAITAVIVGAQKLAGYLGVLGGSFYGFFRAVAEALSGNLKAAGAYFKGTIAEIKDGFKQVEADADKTAAKLTAAFNTGSTAIKSTTEVTKLATAAIQTHGKALDTLEEVIKRVENTAKLAGQGEYDTLVKLIQGYLQVEKTYELTADERLKIDAKIKDADHQLAAAKMADDAVLAAQAEQELKDFTKRETLKLKTVRTQIDQELKLKLQAYEKLKKMDSAYGTYVAGLYEQEATDVEVTEEKKNEYAEKAAEIRKGIAERELATEKQVLGDALALASDAFGDSKAISIAKATISTYEGAANALAEVEYPLNIVAAALVIADGIAQVVQIENTDPSSGKGFDDARNDFASYVGGQRWAKDMTDQFTAGASSGFAAQMTNQDNRKYHTSTTNKTDRRVTNNIRMAGITDSGSKIAMQHFARQLQTSTVQDNRRTLR